MTVQLKVAQKNSNCIINRSKSKYLFTYMHILCAMGQFVLSAKSI